MKKIVPLFALLSLASLSLAVEPAEDTLDYGDHTSVTLTVKAWDALGAGKYSDAVKFTNKCAELYEEQAREMQASLSAKAAPDDVHDYWALNDVGTSYFIRGEALMKLDRDAEAMAAFKVVVEDLYYAQAWDPKGWFWSPSDAAAPKIQMIKARQNNDF